MEEKTNYTIVGLGVLILTASLIAVGLWLSVGFHQKRYHTYAVYMHEGVSGLGEESQVKYNGVQVGKVAKIRLNPSDPQQVKLLLNIEEGTPITTSTSATLISQGITGTTYVGLSADSSDLTPLQKIPNEPYPIIPSKPSLFTHLDTALKEITENIKSVGQRINNILDDENTANVKKSLANFKNFTHVLSANSENLNHILNNLAQSSKKLPNVMNKFGTMAENMSTAGKKVGETMDKGKAAIERISEQTLPPADTLIRNLGNVATNLEKLSEEVRQNPSVILRGSAPPKKGPGE